MFCHRKGTIHVGCTVPFALHFVGVLLLVVAASALPPRQLKADSVDQADEPLGLYNASHKVIVLTARNFDPVLFYKCHANLVEFYNSYCGHCQRYARNYTQLAEELQPWRDLLRVNAIDCATSENNHICRHYEIMEYPSVHYFGRNVQNNKTYGRPVPNRELRNLRSLVAQWLTQENHTAAPDCDWPHFEPLTDFEAQHPTDLLANGHDMAALVYEPDNSTAGIETILNFHRYPDLLVRRVKDHGLATKLRLSHDSNASHSMAIIAPNRTLILRAVEAASGAAYRKALMEHLQGERHITEKPTPTDELPTSTVINVRPPQYVAYDKDAQDEILQMVKAHRHAVYQADLELAMQSTLFNEIPRTSNVDKEQLAELKKYLGILKRYNPLNENGRNFVSDLLAFVEGKTDHLAGKDFQDEAERLRQLHAPIFSATQYVGCRGSRPGLRGFTCSLWTLFHYLTVQASNDDTLHDAQDILGPIHDYVRRYFGCSDCSQHFQDMAKRQHMVDVTNKNGSVLWLWAAHNEVNARIAGDITEDPEFPKIQFPSPLSCPQCHQNADGVSLMGTTWNSDAVLAFLHEIYHRDNIQYYGTNNETLIIGPSAEKLQQTRHMMTYVFSDNDIRIGLLLYVFCILMIVTAFKLFAFKSYRKKSYTIYTKA